jgi:selenocysteine lyase/cysteine desulfurase
MRLLEEAGIAAISLHIRSLQEKLLTGLESLPLWHSEALRLRTLLAQDRLGSILSLHHGERGQEALQKTLRAGIKKGIYASIREGYLRIALHGWHSPSDIDRLLTWLAGAQD